MEVVVVYDDGEDIKDKINRVITQEREKDEYYEDAFFIIDMDDVIKQMEQWRKYLPRVKPHYPVKCNDDPKILSLLADLGVFFDCASRNEMASILDLGVEPNDIVYSQSVKCLRDIRYAASKGVDLMAFDNEEELIKVKSLHPNARLLLRIKPSDKYEVQLRLSVQYGCEQHEIRSLLTTAKNMGLNVVGISFHVGSGVLDTRVYTDAIDRADRAFTIASELDISLSVLDIGGGFFGHKAPPVEFKEVAGLLNSALDDLFPVKRGVRIIAEPGRYFVSSCATLVITVIGKRVMQVGDEKEFRYFGNDSIHGTFNDSFPQCTGAKVPSLLKILRGHRGPFPYFVRRNTLRSDSYECEAPRSELTYKSSVWGHTCAHDDCLFDECHLPELEIGDRLFVENVGAYPTSVSKGMAFNGMPQPIPIHICSKKKENLLLSKQRKMAGERRNEDRTSLKRYEPL